METLDNALNAPPEEEGQEVAKLRLEAKGHKRHILNGRKTLSVLIGFTLVKSFFFDFFYLNEDLFFVGFAAAIHVLIYSWAFYMIYHQPYTGLVIGLFGFIFQFVYIPFSVNASQLGNEIIFVLIGIFWFGNCIFSAHKFQKINQKLSDYGEMMEAIPYASLFPELTDYTDGY